MFTPCNVANPIWTTARCPPPDSGLEACPLLSWGTVVIGTLKYFLLPQANCKFQTANWIRAKFTSLLKNTENICIIIRLMKSTRFIHSLQPDLTYLNVAHWNLVRIKRQPDMHLTHLLARVVINIWCAPKTKCTNDTCRWQINAVLFDFFFYFAVNDFNYALNKRVDRCLGLYYDNKFENLSATDSLDEHLNA